MRATHDSTRLFPAREPRFFHLKRLTTGLAASLVAGYVVLASRLLPAPVPARFATFEALQAYLRWTPTRRGPLVLAHRGGAAPGFPENNLATFQHTWAAAPTAILEMDVRMTQDSVLALLHDETLDRETTGSGPLSALPWAAARQLRLKGPDGHETPLHISRLRDVLAWNQGRALLALDAKPGLDLDRLLRLIAEMQCQNAVLVILYSLPDALRVHRAMPRLMLAVGVNQPDDLTRLDTAGLPYANLVALTPMTVQEPTFYQALHQRGLLASMGTYGAFDARARASGEQPYATLFPAGIDIITTDRPLPVQSFLRRPHQQLPR